MSQAIQTKYLGATGSRGSRMKATAERGSIIISYDHGSRDMHRDAALALIQKFVDEDERTGRHPDPETNPWNRPFVSGALPDGTEAHVYLD